MESLRQKAIVGSLWFASGRISTYTIEFITGIILARLLAPKEFGLIGMITVIISISQVFINSGISQAIIRKQDCSQKDYSTAFYFNFVVGLLSFIIIFSTAPLIGSFYHNKVLVDITRVISIVLVINSFSIIQQALLTKDINFKLHTKISMLSSVISGSIAIIMSVNGSGVWSLVAKTIIFQLINSILLWIWSSWRPTLTFSAHSFKELFGFGSKLLFSGLLSTVFVNLNYLVIGRYFSAQVLGYYTRAELFKNIFSENIGAISLSVGYPILSSLQNDRVKLKEVFKTIFSTSFYVILLLMVGLATMANNLISFLLGNSWLPSVHLLQLLCVLGILYPLNSMNINLLNVLGRSDLYLKLQLFIYIVTIPILIIGIYLGIDQLIIGTIVVSIFGYILFSKETNKHIHYGLLEQCRDIRTPILISSFIAIGVHIAGLLSAPSSLIGLSIQVLTYFTLILIFNEGLKPKEYLLIKNEVIKIILKLNKYRK